ncbi:MAG: hypothetical protein Greene101449_644 [Candidatus Peregrinibacteria bacterium Greene1014_49]|nr:MAG: hypothetical protein Greene101449_644 [Candidatus Peregrinibacteria bacterium Greene1014_49]
MTAGHGGHTELLPLDTAPLRTEEPETPERAELRDDAKELAVPELVEDGHPLCPVIGLEQLQMPPGQQTGEPIKQAGTGGGQLIALEY